MRKISPAGVKADFEAQLLALDAFYEEGLIAFATDSHKSIHTEHTLLAAAVAWEGFVSDMFIAYINRSSTRFIKHLEDSFEAHLKEAKTPKKVFEEFGSLSFPQHLSKKRVHTLANSFGNNITFPNFEELEERAKTLLNTENAQKFAGLSAQQKAVVNALIALRNHIAHRSERSLDAMNDALSKGALHPTGIKRTGNKFHNVGAWLKAVPPGRDSSRIKTIFQTLYGIAGAF